MSVIKSNRNKSTSRKLKRSIAFIGWRRHISGKEKWLASLSKRVNPEEE